MNEVQLILKDLNKKGWTDAAIADELEVSHMTVFRWQKGLRSAQNSRSVLYSLNALLERKRIPKKKRRVTQSSDRVAMPMESIDSPPLKLTSEQIPQQLRRKGYLDIPKKKDERDQT